MSFQIHALSMADFAPLFDMSDADLARCNAKRMIVTESPGSPCRVTLADAEIGETVILTNHVHLPTDSPYRSTHAIYVRENAEPTKLTVGEVPEVIRSRLISIRLFDADDMMIDADVVDGSAVKQALTRAFRNTNVAYVHLHNAKQGCFAAKATRA